MSKFAVLEDDGNFTLWDSKEEADEYLVNTVQEPGLVIEYLQLFTIDENTGEVDESQPLVEG